MTWGQTGPGLGTWTCSWGSLRVSEHMPAEYWAGKTQGLRQDQELGIVPESSGGSSRTACFAQEKDVENHGTEARQKRQGNPCLRLPVSPTVLP